MRTLTCALEPQRHHLGSDFPTALLLKMQPTPPKPQRGSVQAFNRFHESVTWLKIPAETLALMALSMT